MPWITPKRFIASGSKLSATAAVVGFLDKHRAFLNGYQFLQPVLQQYDNQELPPTLTLQTLQSALLDHVLQHEIAVAQAKMSMAQDKRMSSPLKEYVVKLYCQSYDKQGNMSVQLGTVEKVMGYRIRVPKLGERMVQSKDETDGYQILQTYKETFPATWEAEDYGAAQRLADRRLFGREDAIYAEIVNASGAPITTIVQRSDAIARVMKAPKRAATRRTTSSSKSLKWTGKAVQDRSNFSRG